MEYSAINQIKKTASPCQESGLNLRCHIERDPRVLMHPSEIPLHCAKSASLKRVYLINVSVLCGFASFRALCFCQTLSLSFFHSPIDSSAWAGAFRTASACHHSFIGPGQRSPRSLGLSSLMIMTRRLYGFEPFIKLGRLFFTIKKLL